jgi:hypothetical protein
VLVCCVVFFGSMQPYPLLCPSSRPLFLPPLIRGQLAPFGAVVCAVGVYWLIFIIYMGQQYYAPLASVRGGEAAGFAGGWRLHHGVVSLSARCFVSGAKGVGIHPLALLL